MIRSWGKAVSDEGPICGSKRVTKERGSEITRRDEQGEEAVDLEKIDRPGRRGQLAKSQLDKGPPEDTNTTIHHRKKLSAIGRIFIENNLRKTELQSCS